MEMQPALYLIPVNISEAPLSHVLPSEVPATAVQLKYYIVENVRTARRFLKKCDRTVDIDSITFHELNRHTDIAEVSSWLEPLRRGEAMGVMSEAGCPAIADPGAVAVAVAQKEGLKVVPMVGPSSILLSLMASGFNGQGFCFHGYLPIDKGARVKALKDLESESQRRDMTELFIETPYRNSAMLETIVASLRPTTKLCVACDITDPDRETVMTRTVAQWKKLMAEGNLGATYDKRPSIFLIYSGKGAKL